MVRAKSVPWLLEVVVLLALACGGETRMLHAQASLASDPNAAVTDPCIDPATHSAIKAAFRLLCSRGEVPVAGRTSEKAIVIGFLGGFVKGNDVKHPEVLFVNYLRIRYVPIVHAAVF